MGVTENYSGIVVDQNATVTGALAWRDSLGAETIYQTFYLPTNYAMGTTSIEKRYPDLSGIQVMVLVDYGYDPTATLDYTLDSYVFGEGWVPLASGTAIGAHTFGQIWFDCIFPASIPVSTAMVETPMRFSVTARTASDQAIGEPVTINSDGTYVVNNQGFSVALIEDVPYPITVSGQAGFLLSAGNEVTYSVQQGVNSLYYVSPAPHSQGQAYLSNATTPLLGSGTTASLDFRVLALSADHGTDFLGNEYRSCVIQQSGADTPTTSTTWTSPPLPSQFAVVSRYYDVRPQPAVPATEYINFVTNPSFEWDPNGSQTPFAWQSIVTNTTTALLEVQQTWAAPVGIQSLRSTTNFTATAGVGGALYPGVIFETTTSAPLSTGGPITSIPATVTNTEVILAGIVQVTYGNITQNFVTTGAAPGATSIPVVSATPIFAFPTGSSVNATSGFTVIPGASLSASAVLNILSLPTGGSATLNIQWFSPLGAQVATASSSPITTTGVQPVTINGSVAPSTATNATISLTCSNGGAGTFDFYIDDVQATITPQSVPYFDGDQPGSEWLGQKGRSLTAQLEALEPSDDTIVIDGLQLDPLTPNMAVNVYYSTDDAYTSDNMTETNWESKLWTRVPEIYIATQSQEYVFPTPIAAKYMKVEFTNLQAQTYDPGAFNQPVSYKKFPTWVADFFIAQLELPSFFGGVTNIENDAMTLAYDYYLDDLNQAPASPTAAPTVSVATLTDYFNQNNVADQVDASTLSQINLVMNSYQLPTGSIVDINTLLGQVVQTNVSSASVPATVEAPTVTPGDYTAVSSSSREAVVFEQSLPVMYFFVTCRHAYKELQATFEYNRAYYAGIQSLSFIRHNYTTATDTAQYIESGNDTTNAIVQDFDIDLDLNWYTY